MGAVVHAVRIESWEERAPFNESLRERGLHELGLSDAQINDLERALVDAKVNAEHRTILAQWHDPRYRQYRSGIGRSAVEDGITSPTGRELFEFKDAMSNRAHRSDAEHAHVYVETVVTVFKHLLGFLTLRVESVKTTEKKVPVFMLHSPAVQGSEAVYEEAESDKRSEGYALSVFGTGLGRTTTVHFSHSNSLTSRDGAYKRIYVPVTLQTSLIGVYEKGVRVREFGQLESVVSEPPTRELDIGVEELTKEDFLALAGPATGQARNYKLSGDRPGSVHVFKEGLGGTTELTLDVGTDAFSSKTTAKVQLTRSRDVSLEFKLPSGFDYEMRPVLSGFGILWAPGA